MNTRFWNKATLYHYVDKLRAQLRVENSFPVYSKELVKLYTMNPIIEELPFPSTKICGILYRGNTSTSFALNANRTPEMQNFDCMHELIHYFFHDIVQCQRICCDVGRKSGRIEQDTYLEWQANEGAAQFLLPYQTFIPDYIKLSRRHARDNFPDVTALNLLADWYFVSPAVVSNRIDSLNYEIYQYLHGTPIESIDILSNTAIKRKGFNLSHASTYCSTCLSQVSNKDKYCMVCGNLLNDGSPLHRMKYTRTGAGYMIYTPLEQDANGRVLVCPKCHNEQPYSEGEYCIICGSVLVNRCANTDMHDDDGSWYTSPACGNNVALPGNARYCPYCGNETTYLQNKFLAPHDKPQPTSHPAFELDTDGELPF